MKSLLKLFSYRNNSYAFDLEGSISVQTPDDNSIVIVRSHKDQSVTAELQLNLNDDTYQVIENGQTVLFD